MTHELKTQKQRAGAMFICLPAVSHLKRGSLFMCPNITSDGTHCKQERRTCHWQEQLAEGITVEDRNFLKECAALFRRNDPKRSDRLERIANAENV